MEYIVDNLEDSAMKPLHESDHKLKTGLAIMDAFPLGMLGYMVAEERARREGVLDEFHAKINNLVNRIAQNTDNQN